MEMKEVRLMMSDGRMIILMNVNNRATKEMTQL
jgi:hypothetical protein